MKKWIGQAWKKLSGMKESIIRSFKKYGLSVALDGFENAQVSIDGIPNKMPQWFVEEELKLLDDDEDEDPSENDENNDLTFWLIRRYH